jgi:signal transduction histidine kinase
VITNLVSNAIKYGQGKPILVSASASEDEAVVSVEDHGVGIAAESLERIFEPFERADSSKKGSGLGLGLWISKQIVETHGGMILAESTLGEGARFVVRLPLRSPGAPQNEQQKDCAGGG